MVGGDARSSRAKNLSFLRQNQGLNLSKYSKTGLEFPRRPNFVETVDFGENRAEFEDLDLYNGQKADRRHHTFEEAIGYHQEGPIPLHTTTNFNERVKPKIMKNAKKFNF